MSDRGRIIGRFSVGVEPPRVKPGHVPLPAMRAGLPEWARGRVSNTHVLENGAIEWSCCHRKRHPGGRWDNGTPGPVDGSACRCECGCCTPEGKPRAAATATVNLKGEAAPTAFDKLFTKEPATPRRPEEPGSCCMNNETGCYDERCSCECAVCRAAGPRRNEAPAPAPEEEETVGTYKGTVTTYGRGGWATRPKCRLCKAPKGRTPWPKEDVCWRHSPDAKERVAKEAAQVARRRAGAAAGTGKAARVVAATAAAGAAPSRNGAAGHVFELVPVPVAVRAKGAGNPYEGLILRTVKAMKKGLAVRTNMLLGRDGKSGVFYRYSLAWARANKQEIRFHVTDKDPVTGKPLPKGVSVVWATPGAARGRGK